MVEAYDLWASNYDSQPGNLMLDLDEIVFSNLLKNMEITNKHVADIGCGTGRHWAAILEGKPASLTGFDVSAGMLNKLNEKYPAAHTYQIIDNTFLNIDDASYDVIISTLTVAHIENLEEALRAWCRILKDKGEIIITDFHPDALASGGKRTFKYRNVQIAVKNFVHPINIIKEILLNDNIIAIDEYEKRVDESVKDYYLKQNALHVYEKFKGFSMIYGIRFKKL
ncbi:MAG TPA: methyltransferase domain-containing protein [Mucilaginibacter sp.]